MGVLTTRTKERIALLVIAVLGLPGADAWAEQEHPFLICKREQFRELQRRSLREPWKSMAQRAIKIANGSFSVAQKGRPPGEQIALHVGAVALAYIVDAANRPKHAKSVRECITRHLNGIHFGRGTNGWDGCVPPMNGAFNCILALDIVYKDLTAAQIEACEAVIQKQMKKVSRNSRSWPKARLAAYGTFDIYKGVMTGPDERYYKFLMEEITEDGVAGRSPGYSLCRIVGTNDRFQKAAYMDVLEFTGVDRRYYKNERLRGYFRWIYSVGYNPAGFLHLFGDMHPRKQPGINGAAGLLLGWRVGRFDKEAAGYFARTVALPPYIDPAWGRGRRAKALEPKKPPGHVLPFVLMNEPLPAPLAPKSELYMKGGAFFRERQDSNLALGGALYNITSGVGFHTHHETNGLALNAYGNNLLVNGGWLAPSTRPPSRNNTLSINGGNHRKMHGAGLEEGLLGEDLDYACGLSGPALGDDSFKRSLILVHSSAKTGGYFVTVDEVDADAGEKVHAYLQTASESPLATVTPKCEYRASINHHAAIKTGVSMSIFYATEPVSVKLDEAPSSTSAGFGNHRRLEAVYDTDAEGDKRIITVLFPHDGSHPKAQMTRTQGEGYTGARVSQGRDLTDSIYESDGTADCTDGEVTFRAKVAVVRRTRKSVDFYFGRKARHLAHKTRLKHVGFESDADVSIYMKSTSKGMIGMITGPGGKMTFRSPGIRGLILDDKPLESIEDMPGSVTVEIPSGQHSLELTRRRYSKTPARPTPKPRKTVSRPKKPVAERTDEQKASSMLSMARNFLANGARSLAKKKLEQILRDYPDTDSAAAAKKLLRGL